MPDLTKVEPLFEYELDPMFRGKPKKQLRPVKIAGETWLCVSQAPAYVRRRLCRVPEGITPKAFSFDQGAQRLTIRFDGGEEEVVINTRTGAPLTGSERTVPHLHLWKKLSGRPFTDVWQNTMDAMKRREQQEAAAQGQPAPSETGASDESIPRRNGRWLWLALGALVLGGGLAAALRWRRATAAR